MAWFRLHARRVAALVLVAWASLGAATAAPHHEDCHDAVCLTASDGHHDASSHRIGAPSEPHEHALHCVVCHWIRAFKPGWQSEAVSSGGAQARTLFHVEAFPAASASPAAQPPLRAPPLPQRS